MTIVSQAYCHCRDLQKQRLKFDMSYQTIFGHTEAMLTRRPIAFQLTAPAHDRGRHVDSPPVPMVLGSKLHALCIFYNTKLYREG
jgi:hypothetical protein